MTALIKNRLFIYIIPFILGLVSSFSLPPYNLFLINFITFPLMLIYFLSNYKENKWVSFNLGWMFGFGYFISSLYWITNSLTFEDSFKVLIPFALILIPLFLGIFYGLITYVCSFFNLEKKFLSILIFSLFFSLSEFLRANILGGFPWNLIAFSWSGNLNFIQILSYIGTYAFNLICITIFLIPAIIFFNYKKKIKIYTVFILLLLIFSNIYYGSVSIKNYTKNPEKIIDFTIKIVSPKITINRYFENFTPEEILIDIINLSNPKKSEQTLFIFPEGVLTGTYLQEIKNYRFFFSESYSENHKIILGINSLENKKIFNSLVVIDHQANILAKYNKNKLVPFGEFVPFENILAKFGLKKITQGYQSFSSDKVREIINVNNLSFIPLICYEIIYSGLINKLNEDFDFLLNISEDGWFGETIGPHQHFSHSIFRSIEEGKNLIRSANNGTSAFINPKGQLVDKIKSTNSGFIEIKAFKSVEKTIFSTYGNMIFFYFIFFYISLIFFIKKIGR